MKTKQELINYFQSYSGALNLDFGLLSLFDRCSKKYQDTESIAFINIDDVIESSWGISSQYITTRLKDIMATDKEIVFIIDSPGGCSLEHQKIRYELKNFKEQNPDKKLYSFVDGYCTSAAYGIAAMTDSIFVNEGIKNDVIGSIGTIMMRADYTKKLEKDGVGVTFYTSGKQKAYGSPYLPLSTEEDALNKKRLEETASAFFEDVAKKRNLSIDYLKDLEAGVFTPEEALRIGLIDEIISFEELIEKIQLEKNNGTATINNDNYLAESTNSMDIKELEGKIKTLSDELTQANEELASYKAKEKASSDTVKLVQDEKAKLEASLTKTSESLNLLLKEKREQIECAYQAFTGESLQEHNKDLFDAIQSETDINLLNINLKKYKAYAGDKASSFTRPAESPVNGKGIDLKAESEALEQVRSLNKRGGLIK